MKNRENYEIIDPVDVGINESSINLTARSGRAALKHRLERLGYELSKKELDETYEKFLELADKKKDIKDEDLVLLVGKDEAKERKIKLHNLQVLCGKSTIPTATVTLDFSGELFSETASGNGPVDASFAAIKKLIHHRFRLEEYLVQAITRGSDDLGKVHVQIENKGNYYYGFSGNVDVITASVEALIDAVNNIV